MSDLLVDLSTQAWFRQTVKRLGLPLPTPEKLRRPKGPVSARPLDDRRVAVALGTDAALADQLAPALARAGASPRVVADALPAAFVAAGEAYGRPATLVAPGAEPPEGSVHGLIFDATGLSTPASLTELHGFFQPWLARMGRCGRALVIGRPPASLNDPAAAASAAALEGFVRSLAKELGRKGATAHVVYVAKGAEDRLEPLLRFLLSDRAAFLTGQPWTLSAAVPRDPRHGDGVAPLAGLNVVLTGAARGIGEATAHLLAGEGAHVIGIDRPGDEGPLAEVMRAVGGTPLALDITDPDAPTTLSAFIAERFGTVHAVIHNAGITRDKTLARMKAEHWDQTVAVNLGAVVALNTALLATGGGLADGGAIVCLSSVAGLAGNVGQTNYAASKAGVAGYVRALAVQVAARGIAVNAVAPGFIETRMTAAIPAVTREVGRRLSALGQGGEPSDVGQLLTWLVQPESAGLTGQVVRACGGMFIGA